MPERKPPPQEHERDKLDTSYEDAMQARIDRLAQKARMERRRNMLLSLGAFVVLVFVMIFSMLAMKHCKGGKAFRDAFSWRKPRR